jgi:uncharacterized protein YyaL (SSP411 family)
MSNRLSAESSPYLLQHQNNPVDWYPWGDEALTRAKAENKPILLSIGYSACHWCHVMAHESFESPEIAGLMNDHYINIKVDREERPDLDQIYQNVAQAMTKSGGWPLTVFLTPDLKPFYGGTYFPPEDRYGRPGFPRVLMALSAAYRNDPESVLENAQRLTDFIREVTSQADEHRGEEVPSARMPRLKASAEKLLGHVDFIHGGFGSAPKFPNPMTFSFLWRMGLLSHQSGKSVEPGDERFREACLFSLEKMAKGGIYDQLGGGFHRYSVDESWSVPHFEKMLYDNGLLLKLYAEVLLAEEQFESSLEAQQRRTLFVKVLKETVAFLDREMLSRYVLFYAAQDAD